MYDVLILIPSFDCHVDRLAESVVAPNAPGNAEEPVNENAA
jgi:hypothetical protein